MLAIAHSAVSCTFQIFVMLDANRDGVVSNSDVFLHLVVLQHPLTALGVSETQIRTQHMLRCMGYSGSSATEKVCLFAWTHMHAFRTHPLCQAFTLYHHVLRFYATDGNEFETLLKLLWK